MALGSTRAFTISPKGRWTARQLKHVAPAIADEASERGFRLSIIEVTTHNDEVPWFMISMICMRHEVVVEEDSACELCIVGHHGRSQRFSPPAPIYLGELADGPPGGS